jgi:hypothetical protein
MIIVTRTGSAANKSKAFWAESRMQRAMEEQRHKVSAEALYFFSVIDESSSRYFLDNVRRYETRAGS